MKVKVYVVIRDAEGEDGYVFIGTATSKKKAGELAKADADGGSIDCYTIHSDTLEITPTN
jgi:hypothetical protein